MQAQKGLWGEETKHFHQLSPDHVIEAAEVIGKRLTGRIIPLNSLENRVYEAELATALDLEKVFSQTHVIIKFYRPGRWSKDQILEEHFFLTELSNFEIPVVSPIKIGNESVHFHQKTGLWFSLFPKVLGRLKDELGKEEIEQVGRLIGRIHNIGSSDKFSSRLTMSIENFIDANKNALEHLPPVEYPSFKHYLKLLETLSKLVKPIFEKVNLQRIHGDFHHGNILWTSLGPMAVDFDDCLTGPVEQDLWLLFPGKDSYSNQNRERFLDSYMEMTRKKYLNLNITEILRTFRMVHFNAWIAKRWEDQSFQRVFPHFVSPNYWDHELIELRGQLSLIQEFGLNIE